MFTPLPVCTCSRRFPSARAHAASRVHVLMPLSQCTCSRHFLSARAHAASRVHVLTPLPECTCSRVRTHSLAVFRSLPHACIPDWRSCPRAPRAPLA
eukprot:359301-Chlamydomonas_euryale.AAC.1